jgi:hypothetical protein
VSGEPIRFAGHRLFLYQTAHIRNIRRVSTDLGTDI